MQNTVMFKCTAWKMQNYAVILLFIPHLLEAGLISKPNNDNRCVGNDTKLDWKYDNPAKIAAVFYKVQLPGGSLVNILEYIGLVANVLNNYNVRWDGEAGSVTIVNPTFSNTGNYSIDLSYSDGSSPDAHTVSMLFSDPPKAPNFTKSGWEFTCTYDSLGTSSVSLYSQLDGVKQTTTTVTADIYKKVECCIDGDALKCMPGQTGPYCITAQKEVCKYCKGEAGLTGCYGVVLIIVVMIFVCSTPDLPRKLMMVVIIVCAIIMWIIAIVALILMVLIITDCGDTKIPIWCIALTVVTMVVSWPSVIVTIPAMKRYIIDHLWKDEKDPAALLFVMIVNLSLLQKCCCKNSDGRIAVVVQKYWFPNDSENPTTGGTIDTHVPLNETRNTGLRVEPKSKIN